MRRRRGQATRRVELQVVIAASTLLGVDAAPAMLRGYGALPAELAHRILADPAADPLLRRLVCDPVDGRLLSMDSAARCFDGDTRRFCTWRDQASRFPGSTTPIRDIDHLVEYARGGPTTISNGHGLDKASHVLRDHPRVKVRALTLTGLRANSPTTEWTLPNGHTYRSHPPPALGHGSHPIPSTPTPPPTPPAQDQRLQQLLNQVRRT